ncbi:membrane-bound lytic murein transglycosylase MltF [Marinimicrobium sp. ABcell2]|uniref:membrane-bound lytic murein transglycosylase MltF n=1 Tax=Marinimicrobium sp. ABcell2 TaxID=3069751 RepID=UPI0027B744CF|nr:membrane-bound lytic murein transglycosylase MltF [Marinimicrobium sp. ABcell2]MDQ2075369.1 membrane-bound lytic murein transglycosylase MltF [Marinimicrobium sp. ABcell2]
MDVSKKRTIFSPLMHAVACLMLIACSALLVGSKPPTTLERVLALGELRVASRNGPTTYYRGPYGYTGFEYQLLKGFADELGVELVIEDQEDLEFMLHDVRDGRAHLAAAGLTVTESRSRTVRFSTPYKEVSQILLYNSRAEAPSSIEDLIGKDILVISKSAHAERLRELQRRYPTLTWREQGNLEMIDLLEMVHSGTVDHAIVDSNAYQLNRHTFPRAWVAFELGEPQPLAWAFPRSRDESLYQIAQNYLERSKNDGTVARISQSFYEHIDEVTTGGALLFSYRVEHRLPRWKKQMQQAAEEFDLDWRLLAAIGYQESHWDPNARSYTGVRGLMMLTMAAAEDMGISNRRDPAQSIYGGAKYFRSMYNRLPPGIEGADRTWMALAAYNVGLGHLEDARRLTQGHGGDPNKWSDVREYLPLLAKRQYYRHTRHGYARGWEPVTYVRNIQNFYNILAWHDQQEQRRAAAAEEETPAQHQQRKVSHSALAMPISVL